MSLEKRSSIASFIERTERFVEKKVRRPSLIPSTPKTATSKQRTSPRDASDRRPASDIDYYDGVGGGVGAADAVADKAETGGTAYQQPNESDEPRADTESAKNSSSVESRARLDQSGSVRSQATNQESKSYYTNGSFRSRTGNSIALQAAIESARYFATGYRSKLDRSSRSLAPAAQVQRLAARGRRDDQRSGSASDLTQLVLPRRVGSPASERHAEDGRASDDRSRIESARDGAISAPPQQSGGTTHRSRQDSAPSSGRPRTAGPEESNDQSMDEYSPSYPHPSPGLSPAARPRHHSRSRHADGMSALVIVSAAPQQRGMAQSSDFDSPAGMQAGYTPSTGSASVDDELGNRRRFQSDTSSYLTLPAGSTGRGSMAGMGAGEMSTAVQLQIPSRLNVSEDVPAGTDLGLPPDQPGYRPESLDSFSTAGDMSSRFGGSRVGTARSEQSMLLPSTMPGGHMQRASDFYRGEAGRNMSEVQADAAAEGLYVGLAKRFNPSFEGSGSAETGRRGRSLGSSGGSGENSGDSHGKAQSGARTMASRQGGQAQHRVLSDMHRNKGMYDTDGTTNEPDVLNASREETSAGELRKVLPALQEGIPVTIDGYKHSRLSTEEEVTAGSSFDEQDGSPSARQEGMQESQDGDVSAVGLDAAAADAYVPQLNVADVAASADAARMANELSTAGLLDLVLGSIHLARKIDYGWASQARAATSHLGLLAVQGIERAMLQQVVLATAILSAVALISDALLLLVFGIPEAALGSAGDRHTSLLAATVVSVSCVLLCLISAALGACCYCGFQESRHAYVKPEFDGARQYHGGSIAAKQPNEQDAKLSSAHEFTTATGIPSDAAGGAVAMAFQELPPRPQQQEVAVSRHESRESMMLGTAAGHDPEAQYLVASKPSSPRPQSGPVVRSPSYVWLGLLLLSLVPLMAGTVMRLLHPCSSAVQGKGDPSMCSSPLALASSASDPMFVSTASGIYLATCTGFLLIIASLAADWVHLSLRPRTEAPVGSRTMSWLGMHGSGLIIAGVLLAIILQGLILALGPLAVIQYHFPHVSVAKSVPHSAWGTAYSQDVATERAVGYLTGNRNGSCSDCVAGKEGFSVVSLQILSGDDGLSESVGADFINSLSTAATAFRFWAALVLPRLGVLVATMFVRWTMVSLMDVWLHSALLVGAVHGALTVGDAAALPTERNTLTGRKQDLLMSTQSKDTTEHAEGDPARPSSQATPGSPVGPLLNIGEMYRRSHGRSLLPPSAYSPVLHHGSGSLYNLYPNLGIRTLRTGSDSITEGLDLTGNAPTPKSIRESLSMRDSEVKGAGSDTSANPRSRDGGKVPAGVAVQSFHRSASERQLVHNGQPRTVFTGRGRLTTEPQLLAVDKPPLPTPKRRPSGDATAASAHQTAPANDNALSRVQPARAGISSNPSLASVTSVSELSRGQYDSSPGNVTPGRLHPTQSGSGSDQNSSPRVTMGGDKLLARAVDALLSYSPTMLCVYDGRFAMRSVAGATQPLTGYTPMELLGKELPVVNAHGLWSLDAWEGFSSGGARESSSIGGGRGGNSSVLAGRVMTAMSLSGSDSETRGPSLRSTSYGPGGSGGNSSSDFVPPAPYIYPVTPASLASHGSKSRKGRSRKKGKTPMARTPTASGGKKRFVLGIGLPEEPTDAGSPTGTGAKQTRHHGMGGIRGIHPADRSSIRSKLRAVFKTRREKVTLQFRRQRKDLSFCWVEFCGTVVYMEDRTAASGSIATPMGSISELDGYQTPGGSKNERGGKASSSSDEAAAKMFGSKSRVDPSFVRLVGYERDVGEDIQAKLALNKWQEYLAAAAIAVRGYKRSLRVICEQLVNPLHGVANVSQGLLDLLSADHNASHDAIEDAMYLSSASMHALQMVVDMQAYTVVMAGDPVQAGRLKDPSDASSESGTESDLTDGRSVLDGGLPSTTSVRRTAMHRKMRAAAAKSAALEEAKQIAGQEELVAINHILQDALESVRSRAKVKILANLGKGVPYAIVVNAIRVERILATALANSAELTTDGSIQVKVTNWPNAPQTLSVEVLDTSKKEDSDYAVRLFSGLQSLAATDPPPEHMHMRSKYGLSLFLAIRLADSIGTEVSYNYRRDGRGCVFKMLLPYRLEGYVLPPTRRNVDFAAVVVEAMSRRTTAIGQGSQARSVNWEDMNKRQRHLSLMGLHQFHAVKLLRDRRNEMQAKQGEQDSGSDLPSTKATYYLRAIRDAEAGFKPNHPHAVPASQTRPPKARRGSTALPVAVLEGKETDTGGNGEDDSDEDSVEKARRQRRRASLEEIEKSKVAAALASSTGGSPALADDDDEEDVSPASRKQEADAQTDHPGESTGGSASDNDGKRFGLPRKRRMRILEKVLAVGRQVMKQRRALVRKLGGSRRTRRGNQKLIRQVFTEILGRAPADLALPLGTSHLPSAILRSGHLGLGVRGDPDGLAAYMMTGIGGGSHAEASLRQRLQGMDDLASLRRDMRSPPGPPVRSLGGDAVATRQRASSTESQTTTAYATGIAGTPLGKAHRDSLDPDQVGYGTGSVGPPKRAPPVPPRAAVLEAEAARRMSQASSPDNPLERWMMPELGREDASSAVSSSRGRGTPARGSVDSDLEQRLRALQKRNAEGFATPEEILELDRLKQELERQRLRGDSKEPRPVSRANTWSKAIQEHRDNMGATEAPSYTSRTPRRQNSSGYPPRNPSGSSSSLGAGSSQSGGGGQPAVSLQSSGRSLSSGVPAAMKDGMSLPRRSTVGRDDRAETSPDHDGVLPIDADSSRSLVHGFSGRSLSGRARGTGSAASVASSGIGEVVDAEGNRTLVMHPTPAMQRLGGASSSRLDIDARSFRSRTRMGGHRSGGSRGSSARSLMSRSSRSHSRRSKSKNKYALTRYSITAALTGTYQGKKAQDRSGPLDDAKSVASSGSSAGRSKGSGVASSGSSRRRGLLINTRLGPNADGSMSTSGAGDSGYKPFRKPQQNGSSSAEQLQTGFSSSQGSISPGPKLATPLTKRRKWIEDRERIRGRHASSSRSDYESDTGKLARGGAAVDGSQARAPDNTGGAADIKASGGGMVPSDMNESSNSVITDGTVRTMGTDKLHTQQFEPAEPATPAAPANPFARGGVKNLSGLLKAVKKPEALAKEPAAAAEPAGAQGPPNHDKDSGNESPLDAGSDATGAPGLYRAIADWLPNDPRGELQLRAGDIVEVRQRDAMGWWEGVVRGSASPQQAKWFPSSFVTAVE